MSNNISPLINGQISEHLRENSPLFVGFMETYYKYVSQRNAAIGLVKNHTSDIDIDVTTDEYVSKFYDTYGEYLPKTMAVDRRNFIKLLNDVYSAKGTEKALKLIFLSLFGEEISVSYPSENILRASHGIWESESFFTLNTIFGNADINTIFTFKNVYGDYVIEASRLENISQDTIRVYFKTYSNIQFLDGQEIFSYSDGELIYAGKLIKSPSKLIVQDGGESWQRGQVIVIPGTDKNTLARITSVSPTGSILNLEILDYGYVHSEGQSTTISPYPNKPTGSVVDYTTELVSINPNVYHHTIDIKDYTDGCFETVIGVSDGISTNSYFLEDYVVPNYSGYLAISYSSTQSESISVVENIGLTIDEWLASRATLSFESKNIVSTKGYYSNENGQLSNQQIKVQDNYFYQAFSYLIETTRDISDYRNTLSISHPAGLKLFANLSKTVHYAPEISSYRTLSNDVIYLHDGVSTDTTMSYHAIKSLSSNAVMTDVLNSKYFGKALYDSTTPVDTILYGLNKPLFDSVSAISLDISDISSTPLLSGLYDLETYFLEDYNVITQDFQITIG